MTPEALRAERLADAVAAFDAGNHAWGRYRHFVLATAPRALGVSTAAVREALGEAAICVPEALAGEPRPLLDALRATLMSLRAYRMALPEGVPPAELDEAEGDFAEAAALLSGGAAPGDGP